MVLAHDFLLEVGETFGETTQVRDARHGWHAGHVREHARRRGSAVVRGQHAHCNSNDNRADDDNDATNQPLLFDAGQMAAGGFDYWKGKHKT